MNKTVLGLSVALIAAFCIVTALIVNHVAALAELRQYFVAAWGVTALALFAIALLRKFRAPEPVSSAPAVSDAQGETDPDSQGRFFLLPAYWGVMAACFAGISHFMTPWERLPAAARPAPAPLARPKPTNEAPKPMAVPVVQDPFEALRGLQLRGVTLQGPRSCALLGSRTYFVGETVHGAKLIRIEASGVTFERDGQTLELPLGK